MGSIALLAPVLGNSATKEIALEELSIEGSVRASIVGITGVLPGLTIMGTTSDYPSLDTSSTSLRTPASVLTLPVPTGRVAMC